jgi:Smr domain
MPKTNSAVSAAGDRLQWREAMRGVVPLPGRAAPASSPPPPALVAKGPSGRPALLPSLDRFSGIDRANAERLKRGRHPIEARLDLHGMTQAEAHDALAAFINTSRYAGRRCVLVITGRGESGVLKRAVPRWLDEPGLRPQILAIAPAQPRDGGPGALYLLLRRHRREPSP